MTRKKVYTKLDSPFSTGYKSHPCPMPEYYDPDTTIVSNIKCKKCNYYLPDMTMTDHLLGRFNTECDHQLPDADAICEFKDDVRIHDVLCFQCPCGPTVHYAKVIKINKITFTVLTCRKIAGAFGVVSDEPYRVKKQPVMFVRHRAKQSLPKLIPQSGP